LERLVERSPDLADGWVALVRQLVKAGQRDRAEDALVKAQKKLSAAGELWQLPVAECYEALGKVAVAERHYRLALRAVPDSPIVLRPLAHFYLVNDQPEEALPLLRALIHSPNSGREHAAWARRMAASIPFRLLTLGRPLPKPPDEAELLQLLGSDADTSEDRRARALIKAAHPGRAGEALTLFQQTLSAQVPLTAEEQLRLAQLYDLAGDPNQADELMNKLLNSPGVTGQVIAAQVRRLLGRGDNGEARQWLNQLRKREPDSRRTRDLQALADL
jgi:Flp pilus assembly protein TadD